MRKKHVHATLLVALLTVAPSTAVALDDCCAGCEDGGACEVAGSEGCSSQVASLASSVRLPIRGFSQDTQPDFAAALKSIGRTVYECAGHPELASDEPGSCEPCGGTALKEKRIGAVESIAIEIANADQTVVLGVTPGETLRLSSLTAALRDAPVTIDTDRLLVADGARLHVRGLTCGDCRAKLTKALSGLSGVSKPTCNLGSPDESTATLGENAAAVTHATLRKTIAEAGFELTDLSWTGAAPEEADAAAQYDAGFTGFAKRLGAESELLIHGLVPGGAADRAGLRAGDRLVKINGHVAFEFSREELAEVFGEPKPVKLEVQRDGKTFTVELVPQPTTPGKTAGGKTAPAEKLARESSGTGTNRKVGLVVGDLAPEIDGEDLDAIPFKLSDYRGKVVVLSFWGFW